MKVDSLYQEIILDHYKHPHRRGLREPYDAEVHHVNPTCGDEVTLRVKVADGVVEDVSYEGAGCSISQASTSVLTDLVVGKPVEEAVAVQEEFLRLMQSKGTVEPDEAVQVVGDVAQPRVALRARAGAGARPAAPLPTSARRPA